MFINLGRSLGHRAECEAASPAKEMREVLINGGDAEEPIQAEYQADELVNADALHQVPPVDDEITINDLK